jgi:hypothetical protein
MAGSAGKRWSGRGFLLLAPALWFVPIMARPAAAAGIERRGVLEIEVSFKVVRTAIPDGTVLAISAGANVGDATFLNSNAIRTTATVAGGSASTKIAIHYTWLITSTADQVTIDVGAIGTHGTYEDIGSARRTIALPGDGATTVVKIDTTL